jgi:hypothetical protein
VGLVRLLRAALFESFWMNRRNLSYEILITAKAHERQPVETAAADEVLAEWEREAIGIDGDDAQKMCPHARWLGSFFFSPSSPPHPQLKSAYGRQHTQNGFWESRPKVGNLIKSILNGASEMLHPR